MEDFSNDIDRVWLKLQFFLEARGKNVGLFFKRIPRVQCNCFLFLQKRKRRQLNFCVQNSNKNLLLAFFVSLATLNCYGTTSIIINHPNGVPLLGSIIIGFNSKRIPFIRLQRNNSRCRGHSGRSFFRRFSTGLCWLFFVASHCF